MKQVLVSMRSRQDRDPEPELSNRGVEQRPREPVKASDRDQNQLRPKPTVFVSANELFLRNGNVNVSTEWLPASS